MKYNTLIGKTVVWAEIDGFSLRIKFSDGRILDYSASDNGYSCWALVDGAKQTERDEE